MSPTTHLTLLALSWLLYGLLHSLLASSRAKLEFNNYFPGFSGSYRLLYNLLAGLLLIVPVGLLLSYPGPVLWQWPGMLGWLADAAALLALAGFIWSSGIYDMREFLGLSQIKDPRASAEDQSPFRIAAAHRFVRHPWYFFGLVIVWSREMNAAWLLTAVTLTLYVIVGSRLEEHKLIQHYGEQYRRYRHKVPGLLPRPWRYLSKKDADQIMKPGN
jgi:protein-S-isoprenylcysteine O-methyltransferase Ste14